MMSNKKLNKADREAPHSHLIQILSPVVFVIVWLLDSFVLQLSTILNSFVPLTLRIILFAAFLSLALALIFLSHNTIFKDHGPSNELITDGILRRVRNPMYLGIQLIYIACICLSISLISVGIFVVVAVLYNWMVNYEEKILEQLFGEEFLEYRKSVPKWIPKLIIK